MIIANHQLRLHEPENGLPGLIHAGDKPSGETPGKLKTEPLPEQRLCRNQNSVYKAIIIWS